MTENLLPKHLQDHSYATIRDIYLDINLQYADDISWISNADHKIEDVKKRIPNQLQGVQECSIPCFRKILKITNQ